MGKLPPLAPPLPAAESTCARSGHQSPECRVSFAQEQDRRAQGCQTERERRRAFGGGKFPTRRLGSAASVEISRHRLALRHHLLHEEKEGVAGDFVTLMRL